MSAPRHIDQSCRYIWLSLRRAAMPMSINELVTHWRPVYTALQMEDALKRLTAAGHASRAAGGQGDAWEVTDANAPLPDFRPVRTERPWPEAGISAGARA